MARSCEERRSTLALKQQWQCRRKEACSGAALDQNINNPIKMIPAYLINTPYV